VIDEPLAVIDEPLAGSSIPVAEIDEPLTVIDEPLTVIDEPLAVIDEPLAVIDEPLAGSSIPVAGIDEPLTVINEPLTVIDEPLAGSSIPVAVIDEPLTVIDEPLAVIDEPLAGSSIPVAVIDEPLAGSSIPVTVIDEPVAGCSIPVTGMDEPVAGGASRLPRGALRPREGGARAAPRALRARHPAHAPSMVHRAPRDPADAPSMVHMHHGWCIEGRARPPPRGSRSPGARRQPIGITRRIAPGPPAAPPLARGLQWPLPERGEQRRREGEGPVNQPIIYPEVVLGVPRTPHADIVIATTTIINAVGANFPGAAAEVADATLAEAAYAKAVTNAKNKVPGSVKVRRDTKAALFKKLELLRAIVQLAVDAQLDQAATIAESAKMKLRKAATRFKAEFAADDGPGTGQVHLVARAVPKALLYFWEVSVDQKVWSVALDTSAAQAVVTGLTVGQTYYFRFRVRDRKGMTDYSQVLSHVVR
jgi:hypothetical protein